ncbi:unnamed protein product [Rotaria sordida]|uniref:THAP9-like helix-turn-helix domain-containing protein n=1 Tax=Rotaria sordida TaxID=392033 RepID=A0A815TK29_9BILA|nr:unnamed protein product [Rotaria sordida]CAF1489188.1 unnamed protein product [Rotaria sordida]CAF1504079.1 unnamed protein product [Rotaria sordida]CAF1646205.1 unnamed protein product [Rotaria sordida]CAF4039141.1 unnamed protein product [Rotaria sordida]
MDILQLDELTDDMMNLRNDDFYNFLEVALNKDLCELFRVQGIRDMSSLSSITIDQITQVFTFNIMELNNLKKSLGFVSTDGNFHLRLGYRNLLERLILLVKSKKSSFVKNFELSNKHKENQINEKLLEMWKQTSSSSNKACIPILFPWINNIFQNLEKTKNRYRYDDHIQEFALLIFIFGGRNCYEFLRLNLPAALPHISNLELIIRSQELRMIECEFRFNLLKEYSQINNSNYIFVAEDLTSSITCIDYDVQSNSFIGFSPPLVNGIPESNFFRTENFNELKKWFDELDKSKFINLYMVKSLALSAPPFILSAFGSNNKFTAIDIVKRWLFIHNQCLIQGIRVVGFSTDGDARYLRAMRLFSRFFAELPNFNFFKHHDGFDIKISNQWSWFLMQEQQIFLFMQDPIHIATKIRNRLLSRVAKMKMGSYSIDKEHLIDLIESKSKIEHNLTKTDVNVKDRQNFSSCLRISSEKVLYLLNKNEKAKGTYVYLTLLNLIISGFINKSTTIEKRLYHIWTVVFICRLWFSWIHYLNITNSNNHTNNSNNNSQSQKKIKQRTFITRPTLWCIEINAHTLLYIILLVIKKKLPIDALNTFGFNSQICENTFRIARSLTGPFSSVTNFSVKSFMKRSEKISVVNSIKGRDSKMRDYCFQFPQHHKNDKETYDYSVDSIKSLNLTEYDIEKIIYHAFESAKQYVSMVNMTQLLENKNIYSLPELSHFIKTILSKPSSKIVDYTEDDDSNYDSDDDEFEDDEDGSVTFGDEGQMLPNMFDEEEEEEEEGNIVANDLSNISQQNFKGCRIYDKINSQHMNKFFRIHINSSVKYIHKQTACWLLTTSKNHLSSDRLERVKEPKDK